VELGISGGTVVEDKDVTASVSAHDGEGGLAGVVDEEELAVGGGAVPGMADGATAEKGLGVEADKDFPEDDLIWEVAEERRHSCRRRHGRRPAVVLAAEGR
jgi:hypothetical protein